MKQSPSSYNVLCITVKVYVYMYMYLNRVTLSLSVIAYRSTTKGWSQESCEEPTGQHKEGNCYLEET